MSFASAAAYKARQQATAEEVEARAAERRSRRLASLRKAARRLAVGNQPSGLTTTRRRRGKFVAGKQRTTVAGLLQADADAVDQATAKGITAQRISRATARLLAWYWQAVERQIDDSDFGRVKPPRRRYKRTPPVRALERLARARPDYSVPERKPPRVDYPAAEWSQFSPPADFLYWEERLERYLSYLRAANQRLAHRQAVAGRPPRPLIVPSDKGAEGSAPADGGYSELLFSAPVAAVSDKPRRCAQACGQCARCAVFYAVLRQNRLNSEAEKAHRQRIVAEGGDRYWLAPDYDSTILSGSPFEPVECPPGGYPTGGSWVRH